MTRWLWPILAAYLIGTSFSAMLFERIDHKNMRKEAWSVLGFDIPLSNTLDFYVWATPMVGAGLVMCSIFLFIYAKAHRHLQPAYLRLPPVGPAAGSSEFHKQLDAVVRWAVMLASLGFGGYSAVHLFRHLLKHSVFIHDTDQVFHDAGFINHISKWSLSGDLRYGVQEGITYYAGFQSTACFLFLLVSFCFGLPALLCIFRASPTPREAGMK